MLALTDYLAMDATAMAKGLTAGDFSSSDLVAAAIAQAEKLNPKLNAINAPCFDAAADQARKLKPGAQSPVAGLPFLIKDLSPLAHQPHSNGSQLNKGVVADRSANIVQRYLDAGLIVLGKTNTPEFGLTLTTEPVANGPTRNPWNLAYSTGGSSGGAAAAVAGGIVPVAHASDGGGSIRIPAACCGLFGFKPSRGLTAIEPDLGDSWSGMSVGHVVSRSVRDSALFLDQITLDQAMLYPLPPAPSVFSEASESAPEQLRIALHTTHPFDEAIDPACLDALTRTAALCESLGHRVEEVPHPADFKLAAPAINRLVCIHTYQSVAKRLAELGMELEQAEVETSTRQMAAIGAKQSAADYLQARTALRTVESQMAAFHQQFDIILSPVLSKTTAQLGWLDMNAADLAEYGARFRAYSGFTALYNGTGQPSMSLPIQQDQQGLPVGVMASAAWGHDLLLLQLARQLEQASPWPTIAPLARSA